uniref:DUF3685 domain-containing protein n=1 Tax=Paulinella micropora TaxID=1928728 RepID=A0A1L5YB00_9EUKA|nr:hypothetical protein PCKR_062 [Paulinella micropora]AQX44634.1 hypothetical protein PFK_062 [Paulinella micropora]
MQNSLNQVNRNLSFVKLIYKENSKGLIKKLLIAGRQRELNKARLFLIWLFDSLGFSDSPVKFNNVSSYLYLPSINLDLNDNTCQKAWYRIRKRLETVFMNDIMNDTGYLLAIDALNYERRRDLLLALLSQLDIVIKQLYRDKIHGEKINYFWYQLQPELRRTVLEKMAGADVEISKNGELKSVAGVLIKNCKWEDDRELPPPQAILGPLAQGQPILIEGYLLSLDDHRAALQIEALVSNWLIRTAELIGAEVLSECSQWPELRCYLLRRDLMVTRNLERLRNQLNTQEWWNLYFDRPIRLYESKRLVWRIQRTSVIPYYITEARDKELEDLPWWQQLITFVLETRDAIAPQLQLLFQRIGNIIVIILTQIVGKAIGLIVRGILQGMGRSFTRDQD